MIDPEEMHKKSFEKIEAFFVEHTGLEPATF